MTPWMRIQTTIKRRVDNVLTRCGKRYRAFDRSFCRVDRRIIQKSFARFGDFDGSILFVHSSLSACGQMVGGPETVIASLLEWIGNRSLVMPTHTYCYPDGNGMVPVFDDRHTPSRVGAIADCFWRRPGVVRSVHPTHSLACVGPGSDELCDGHEICATPCGAGTPYEKLVERDSAVLMFGATMKAYTLFHTAEDFAKVPYLYKPKQDSLSVRKADGNIYPFPMWRQDMSVTRRFHEMDIWLEKRGLLLRCKLGRGELLYLPSAAQVHKAVIAQLLSDPWFLVADSAREAVSKRFKNQL